MQAAKRIQKGVAEIPGLKVLSDPEMSVFAIASDSLNVYELGDELSARGWHLDRQQFPASLHMTVNYVHARVVDEFLSDLRDAAGIVRRPTLRKGLAGFMIKAANLLTRLLPEKWVSALMARLPPLLGGGGSGLPGRMA